MLETFPARNGDPTAAVEGILIHSRYDPRKEAARFMAQRLGHSSPATLFLLGVGLGYLIEAARQQVPNARIIAVSVLGATREDLKAAADVHIATAGIEDVRRSISAALRPEDAAGLEVIEWEPVVRAAGDVAQAIRRATAATVSRLNAAVATTGYFGPRYVRNLLRTLLFAGARSHGAPRGAPRGSPSGWISTDLPSPDPPRAVCIAAAGPSLEDAVPWIRAHRKALELWALSSAAPALKHRGLLPDLIVHQDAGYYAAEHAAAFARGLEVLPPVLMPATANLPPPPLRDRVVLISQSTPMERDVFHALAVEPPGVPETGTVAATATTLALGFRRGPVYLAGLDLAHRDLRSHVAPHAFEHYLREAENRFAPLYSQIAAHSFDTTERMEDRARGLYRVSRSLSTYASWFRDLPAAHKRRVKRLCPSPVDLGLTAAEASEPGPVGGGGRGPVGGGGRGAGGAGRGAGAALQSTQPWRAERLTAVVGSWKEAVERAASAVSRGRFVSTDDADIAFTVSASHWVAAVASSRRGDRENCAHHLDELRAASDDLFGRLGTLLRRAREAEDR